MWLFLNGKSKKCYTRLYNNNDNITFDITKRVFPNVNEKNRSFRDIYIYTATICDIVLNPDYPDMECSRKPLEWWIQRFKVFIVVFLLIILKSNYIQYF